MRAWEDFLKLLEQDLGKEIVNKWIRPLKVVRFDACNLYLEAKDSFKSIWFEEHLRPRVEAHLRNNNNKQIKVHISVSSEETLSQKKRKKGDVSPPAFDLTFDELDPSATFEETVTCPSNLLAFKLLQEVCEGGEITFNPIYLFGRTGTGKTHFMMAAANYLRAAGKKVIYVRSDTFTEHVVKAIRTGEMQVFRRAYRNVDALLVDDLEVFSRKGATQEEFFHTFNTLHTEGKHLILSSNCSPSELKYVEPRLVSRFEWGITVPLQVLPKEEMMELLQRKSARLDFFLKPDVRDFLVETFGSNAKTLLKAFDALILRTHLNKGLGRAAPSSLEAVKKALGDLVEQEEKAVLTPGKIIRTVADYYGIKMDDILSKSQARECVLPRQIAMHLCRSELNLPFMKIGDIFSRDHSTVMTSVKQIQKDIDTKTTEIAHSVRGIQKLLH